MTDRRITFRVSLDEGEDADALARRRGYVTVGHRPNLSRLMRALLAEAIRDDDSRPENNGARATGKEPDEEKT